VSASCADVPLLLVPLPVVAPAVYADFPTYTGGVYVQTSTEFLGGHAIKIIGTTYRLLVCTEQRHDVLVTTPCAHLCTSCLCVLPRACVGRERQQAGVC
jgi:hypothetical protein